VPFGVYGSTLRARITTSGQYFLGVNTLFGDIPTEVGRYALLVSIALPEPHPFTLIVLAVFALAGNRLRNR
jgi:hypothetical protein